MPMMKNSTLFFLKKFNCSSVHVSELSEKKTGKSSEEMKSAGFNPSALAIRKILDYASAYNVMETKATGHTEMILN
ncbi:MAG: hypothetical protein V2I31_02405 [Mariniphaga sp.]|jgi:hypothetical protein|nr:hypothetical protein [Mariniphaga sp.]